MPFNISYDYRFDSSGFFDDPDRRAVLEEAATIWESLIQDEFENVPVGTVFSIDNPSNSGTRVEITLDTEIDDVLVFVGAENLPRALALGGFDGVDAEGDVFDRRIDNNFRGEVPSNFEPWTGTITYNSEAAWNFDLAGPAPGTSDFLSVTLHELAHIFGIGTSPIFGQIGASGSFEGTNTVALNGGDPVPLQAGLGHVAEGFDNNTVLLDPFLTTGTRTLPGRFDLALLADIGYEIDGYITQGETPPIATSGDDRTIFGTILGDLIDGLGGADQIQGSDGNDTLLGGAGNDTLFGGNDDDMLSGGSGDDALQGGAGNDTLSGGDGEDRMFGQSGVDTFLITPGGGTVTVSDFDLTTEILQLDGSGFEDAAAAVAAISKPFSNVSQLTFEDGTVLRVFHASQSGTPLTADNFELTGNDDTYVFDDRRDRVTEAEGDGFDRIFATAEVTLAGAEIEQVFLEGTGNLRVNGNRFATEIQGNSGSNILIGGGGGDTITGGEGTDYFAFLTSDAPGATRITDFGGRDQIALDDRFFGLGDGSIDVRDVTQRQVDNALHSGAARYDGRTGELWVDMDGRRGPAEAELIAVIEGGGRVSADDFLLF